MARPRQRVRLEDGRKLDLNEIVRDGFWPRGNEPKIIGVQWTLNTRVTASALITVQREGEDRGSLKIRLIGKFEQRLDLVAERRHLGGNSGMSPVP
jgi:hypothetical protein